MGCSRLSLMKLASVNGANVCELVFISKMDIFSTRFFYFSTIYQVGVLQVVLIYITNTTVTF